MAGSENRFERAQALSAAFDPIIDICVRLGVNTSELESLLRVEFVKRVAATLPRNPKTGKEPSHEEVGLATGAADTGADAYMAAYRGAADKVQAQAVAKSAAQQAQEEQSILLARLPCGAEQTQATRCLLLAR